MDWYNQLNKSSLTPPPIVFKIVWPILYVFMFLSFYFFLSHQGHGKEWGLSFFWIQLIVQFLWIYVFFSLHQILTSFILLLILNLLILITIIIFILQDWISGVLLIPYFLWTLFASYLNGYIVFHH